MDFVKPEALMPFVEIDSKALFLAAEIRVEGVGEQAAALALSTTILHTRYIFGEDNEEGITSTVSIVL